MLGGKFMRKSKDDLISFALSSYEKSQEIISQLCSRTGYPSKQALMEFEVISQWMLVNVATSDGYFFKSELDFILKFTEYTDIALLSGVSWSQFLSLSGDTLKSVIATVNDKLCSGTIDFSGIFQYATSDEKVDLEACALSICSCLAEIDGDGRDSEAYKEEWMAGMKIYYSMTKLYSKPKKKTTFYGFDTDYISRDVSIKIKSVDLNYDPEVCKLTFSITNHQYKSIRCWVKDYGMWLPSAESEMVEGYNALCTVAGYNTVTVDFFIQGDKFNNNFWPECFAEDEGLDEEKCFSELVFMITYDFGDSSDVDVLYWVIDGDQVCITFDEDWAYDHEYDDDDYEDDDCEDEDDDCYGDGIDTSEWNLESILRQEGYTVSQKEGLSDNERQNILRSVLSRNLMTKWQIIEHIELQISLRKNNSIYRTAIFKWERDLQYIKTHF